MTGNLVGADETLFRIVEAMAGADSMGVTEVAAELDLTKSTAHRHLQTLAAHGYAVNDGGTYRLSHQWFHLGTDVKSRNPFYLASRRELVVLAERTGQTAWAAIEEMGGLMFVNGTGARPTHNPDLLVGNWSSITETAAGKSILAALPEERAAEIIENADEAEKSPEDVRTELEYVRNRGYAINLGERISGIYAIGMAAVVDGTVYGAMSLSSPSDDLITSDRESALDALSAAVERVERKLAEKN
ncbi:IclR family transcriptional regulator [Halobellus rufus]|uniref:IclR family transcriptional regulator n=1 Tax=Halobellus rufus TaxID=1448860 RepID=UPI0006790266|nr:IclR family transcriptional regulator C-terminal domain-containing protein [Halobellus rufus]